MPRANGTARNYSNSSSLSPGTWREKCRWDYDAIAATVADLRRRFSPPLTVGLGIEVDYQPQFIDEPLTYLDGHEFDVVLLSVHWAGGRALHLHRRWQKLTAATMLDDYLAAMLSAAELCRELAAAGRSTSSATSTTSSATWRAIRRCKRRNRSRAAGYRLLRS